MTLSDVRAQLAELAACRCEPAWTDRGLHAPECHADEGLLENFDAATAPAEDVITGCASCPWQSNDWWCKREPPPTAAEIAQVDARHRAGEPDAFQAVRGYTGPGDGAPPDWCGLREGPVLVRLEVPRG